MAARLPQWLPTPIFLAVGGALGWLLEPAMTPEIESGAASGVDRPLSTTDVIAGAWLPTATLEQHLRSLSSAEANALLTKLDHAFWSGHPNGRDAWRVLVSRLSEQSSRSELARELFTQVRTWDLPAAARAETMRVLTAALARIPAMTPAMIGKALRGFTWDEVHAAAAIIAEERRGKSIESDASALRQLFVAAEAKADRLDEIANDLVAAAWFREQPEAAIAFAAKARGFDGAIFRPMLRQLYAVDAPAAVAALKQIAAYGKSSSWTGESAFLTGLTAAEFRKVASQAPKEERLKCIAGFGGKLAREAPANVAEFALEFSAAELFTEAFFEERFLYNDLPALLPLFAERDATACREWLSAVTPERRVKALQDAVISSAAYARFCLSTPGISPSYFLLRPIASEDFNAAMRELPHVPESERSDTEVGLHFSAITERYTGDIAGALQALEQLPERLRSKVADNIFSSLALRHQAQVEQWIAANPTSPSIPALQIALADRDAFLPNARREALLAGSLSTINENPGVATVAESYMQFLSKTDPPSAAAWFSRIPEGDQKNRIAQILAQRWAMTDSSAALAWAEQLPPSSCRDDAFLTLAEKQKANPDEALQRVAQIADPERRYHTTVGLVYQWSLADPERAMSMIAEVDLSDEHRRKLQAIVDSSPTRLRSSKASP